jgi:hypothetical protein
MSGNPIEIDGRIQAGTQLNRFVPPMSALVSVAAAAVTKPLAPVSDAWQAHLSPKAGLLARDRYVRPRSATREPGLQP